jgi:uncharacterized phage-associated protein
MREDVITVAKAKDAARFFVNCGTASNEPVTNLRLNKLLYYAQGIHLANTGQPLFPEDIEAWPLGPVVPVIYHEYKSRKESPIVDVPASDPKEGLSDTEYASLLDALCEFGIYTTAHLIDLTHETGGPWDSTIKARQKIIPLALIMSDSNISARHSAFVPSWDNAERPIRREQGVAVFHSDPDDKLDEWPEYNAL